MAGEEPALLVLASLAGLRIGIPRGVLFDETEGEVAAAFDRCLRKVEQAGARVAELSIDDLLADMRAATKRGTIAAMEGAEIHADWLATGASVPVDPHVSGPLSRALAIPASVYIRTIRRRTALAAAMDERLASIDVLALPTTPIVAPSIAAMAGDEALREQGRRPLAAQHAGRQPVRPLRDLAADAGHGATGWADAGGAQWP